MNVEKNLRLIAGTFVMASVLLGMYVDTRFLWFTLFIGANLFQSGLTNWCPMMTILRRVHRQKKPPVAPLVGLVFMAITAPGVAGCASAMTVSSHVDRSVNFAQYRTYDWGPADALPTGDPRLDQNPFFRDQVQGAVEKQLAGKKLALSAADMAPDLLVHYHASVTQRLDVFGVDRKYGSCVGDDCQAQVVEYDAGTLVIDIVDRRTNKVIWRGWAQDAVEDILDDDDRLAKKIGEAVPRIFATFPKGS